MLLHEVLVHDAPATWGAVIDTWHRDARFTRAFAGWLADAPFHAFRFETPALETGGWDAAFAFVLIDAPELERPVSPDAFAEHFRGDSGERVVSFSNLGGDARLIVPRPPDRTRRVDRRHFGHLAAFARGAGEPLQQLLWQRVAHELRHGLGGPGPVWLSTAGDGVPWLHLRLDAYPKYYRHTPFAASPAGAAG